jgi:hypothetical protein
MSAVASVIFIYSLYCSWLGTLLSRHSAIGQPLGAEAYSFSTSCDVEQPACILVIDLM